MSEIVQNTTDNKRIAKNMLFLYFRMLVLLVVNFYTTRVVLQSLGVNDFGLYNVVAGFVALIGFINQSMTNSIQRFLNFAMGKRSVELLRNYFSSAVYVQGIIALAVLALSEVIGVWCVNNVLNLPPDRYMAANIVFQFSIISFVIKILETPFVAVIISHERMGIYAIVSLVEGAMQLAIAFSINYIASYRVEFYSLMLLVLTSILSLTYFFYSNKISSFSFTPIIFDKNGIKEILSFSGWNLFGTISGTIKSQGINILMNMYFGVVVNAAQGIAHQVLGGCMRFMLNFQVAVNPQIVKSYSSNDRARYLYLTYMNAKVSFFLMWILVLPISFNIKEILEIWLGEGNVPQYADCFVILILLTGLIDTLGAAITVPIYSTGRIKVLQITVGTITIMVLPISLCLYELGFEPQTSMFVSLSLSFVSQFARVKIWSNLVNEPSYNYVKSVIFPIVIIVLITFTCTIIVNECFHSNTILSIILVVTFSIATIYYLGLDKYTRLSINNAIASKLFMNKNH